MLKPFRNSNLENLLCCFVVERLGENMEITKHEFVKVEIQVEVDKRFIDRDDWVKYYTLPLWHAKQLGNLVKWIPDDKFNKFLGNQVQSYLNGSEPPAAIQSAIMNLADDYITGREVTIKAGDFIALQNHFRNPK